MTPTGITHERGRKMPGFVRESGKRGRPEPERMGSRLAQMKHDIRGPLNAVLGLSGLLAASDLGPRHKEMAAALQSSAEDLCRLIDEMFDPGLLKERKALPQASEPAPGKKRRILLVEDYHPTVLTMSNFLEELGYDYSVARTGHEALEKFSDGFYDFILMDLQLPDIDGLEVTRRIRTMEKEKNLTPVPIVATSGQDEDRKICLRMGMNDCLSKPFGIEELAGKLAGS